jgi:transcriptional regulator with XRE-family HTH domain
MRDLRFAAHLSLTEAEDAIGVSGIVIGSYERGDRQPPLAKIDTILKGYGYRLVAVPVDFDAVRLPSDMAAELRAIADQIEKEKLADQVEMEKRR